MTDRPSTPPPAHPGALPPNPLTPEQVRRMEENRLRAKALRQQSSASEAPNANTPNGFIAGQKRPHASISSTTPPSKRDARDAALRASAMPGPKMSTPASDSNIRPAKKFEAKSFIEYDFSTMTDTKGGFLSAQDDPHNAALQPLNKDDPEQQKPAHMTMAEWERNQLLKNLRRNKAGPFEPGISALSGKEEAKKCMNCGSLELDWQLEENFGCKVCNACKEKYPEKYSLLTKTEVKEDYLLTDPECRDRDILRWIEKPNPHKATWNNMQLYLRYQVEEYAFSEQKWGSPEKLDEEFERRQKVSKERKEKKFKEKLNELKKKTRVEAYKRARRAGAGGEANFGDRVGKEGRHVHEWGRPVEDPETGIGTRRCECGMEMEEIEF